MSYNLVVIISVLICAIISYVLSNYLVMLVLDKDSGLFQVAQLIIAIVSMTTFYAPIKYILIKYMNIDELESENKND